MCLVLVRKPTLCFESNSFPAFDCFAEVGLGDAASVDLKSSDNLCEFLQVFGMLVVSCRLIVDPPKGNGLGQKKKVSCRLNCSCSHFTANVVPKAVIFVLDFAQVPEIIVRQTEVNT